jgi:hypothetical protein
VFEKGKPLKHRRTGRIRGGETRDKIWVELPAAATTKGKSAGILRHARNSLSVVG